MDIPICANLLLFVIVICVFVRFVCAFDMVLKAYLCFVCICVSVCVCVLSPSPHVTEFVQFQVHISMSECINVSR